MPKSLLLTCLLTLVMTLSHAQDDISSFFLLNNGFDTSFNYDATTSGNVSGNVINDIYGWELTSVSTYTVAGTFAYNTAVSFNNSSTLPAAGYNGSTGGALALSTGWTENITYAQTITLPKGKYRLVAAYYNVGSSTAGSSMLGWYPVSGTDAKSTVSSFPIKTWLTDTISFTLTASTEGTVQIGYQSTNVTSNTNAKVLVDYVKLLCDTIDKSSLRTLVNRATKLYGTGTGTDAAELLTVKDAASTVYNNSEATPSEVLAAIQQLTDAIFSYQLKNASASSPLTMTSYITNPSFEDGTEGWTYSGFSRSTTSVFSKKSGTACMERWVAIGKTAGSGLLAQTVTGLPNGRYKLTAGVCNIQQKKAGSSLNNGTTPQTGAWLYGGNVYVAADTSKTKTVYFTVTDGTATIGFKAENATGNWVACDNFQLYYIGASTIEDKVAALNALISSTEDNVLTKRMQAYVRAELNEALADARKTVAEASVTEEALAIATATINLAIADVDASIARYDSISAELPYANTVLGWYADDSVKSKKMQDAIDAANTILATEELTDAELRSALASLIKVRKSVDKKIYTAEWSMGNVNDKNNTYSLTRTRQSKNFVLFWEKDYGENPETFTCGNYTVDIDAILSHAEEAYKFYADSLKFINTASASANSSNYKMIIRLRYSTEWEATGSGIDDRIGLLTLTPWAHNARSWHTLYHEIGHCFQYQTHCDNGDQNGWMYAIGNGTGFWEQCAQWQGYKMLPDMQFNSEYLPGYYNNAHKHILHEDARYTSYFVHDYWTYLHGMDFIGRLWNESKSPQDAIQAYISITKTNITKFNDEMYDCAARFATWDIPALKTYGASHIDDRPQPEMIDNGDDYWRISADYCPENTGYNVIRLNAPTTATTVTAYFEGLSKADGYRSKNAYAAGWRYGFVAMKNDGTRVYSNMASASYTDLKDTLRFECPISSRLYLVVTGAPKIYWQHLWDNDNTNDEQWPYMVKFENTNKYGSPNPTAIRETGADADVAVHISGNTLYIYAPSASVIVANAGGQTVANGTVNGEWSKTLPAGLYTIKVGSGQKSTVRKVVIR